MTGQEPNEGGEVTSPPKAGEVAAGNAAERAKEPGAVLLARDLLRWLLPLVGKFQKSLRCNLGVRIDVTLGVITERHVFSDVVGVFTGSSSTLQPVVVAPAAPSGIAIGNAETAFFL